MSSLAHCIDISGISKIEGDKLKAAAKVYRSEGYSAKDANTGAVQDAISAINGERNDIVKQIKKQLPEHFKEPEAKPEKIEEKKAKPIPEIKEKAVVAPKPIEKPTEQLGKIWIKNIQKPIMSAREITKGKNKDKYEVVLIRGRDAEGNIIPGLKKIVAKDDIVAMPLEKPTGVEPLFQKRPAVKGLYRPGTLEDAIKIREESGSLDTYDAKSQKEFLAEIPPKDGKLTVYRATSTGEAIKPGDYVTNSLEYAKLHIESNLDGKGKIAKIEATLDDIFPADAPKEFWYAPKSIAELKKLSPLFQKRTTATSIGIFEAPDLQPQINEITARWKNAPEVEVVQSQAELPEGIQSYIKKDDIVDGVYYHGKVYIVADNTASIEAAAKTLLHESFGHYGLREMLGNDFGKIMQDVYISKREEVQKIADEYGYDIKTEKGKALSAEEWLSREAVNKPESGWVKRVMAVIRHFARRLMPTLRLSDAEIRQMLEAARSYVERSRPKVSDGIGAYFGVPGYQMAGEKAIGVPTGQLVKAQEMERDINALTVKEDMYHELRGETGPFHKIWRLIDENTGKKISNKQFSSKEAAERALEKEKKDRKKEMWRETGWMRGVENRWKFEIDDSGAELKVKDYFEYINTLPKDRKMKTLGGDGLSLVEILKHKSLYAQYPSLMSMKVDVVSAGDFKASYDEQQNRIHFRDTIIDKDSLLHEIQHAIQEIEGFARGGSEEQFLGGGLSGLFSDESTIYKNLLNDKIDAEGYISRRWLDESTAIISKKDFIELNKKDKGIARAINRLKGIEKKMEIAPKTAFEAYKRLAGEIEARDTAARAKLTPAQRGQSFNKVKGLFEQTQKIRQFDKYKTEEKTWLASDMTDADLKSRNESSAHKKLYAIENEIMDMGYNLNQKLVREALAGDKSAQDQLIQFPYESQGIPQDQWIITEGKGTSFRIEETPAFAKRKPSTVEIDTTGYLPTEVEKRMARAKGGPKVEFKEKLKEQITEIRHQRQHFPELKTIEDETLRAKVNDILRRHQEIPETAKNEAVQKIQSFTKNLSKDGYNVYRMNIILADMMRDIHNGLTYDGKLPFGFKTTEEVESAYAKFQEISRQHPEIADALKKRSDTINDIKRRLVKVRLLKKEVLKDDDYFHHQVIEYWEKKYGMMTGSRDVRTHWRPWMTARKGSPLDYNTDYIEAEYTAISQQLAQLKVVETLKRIKKEADIYVSLKREAKTKNVDNLWKLLRERGEIEINDKTGKEIDPLLPWKQKIAMSNANLAQMASEGTLEYDSEWEGIVNALADSYDGWKANKDDIPDYPRPGVDDARWFHFLSYLINTKKPGANWAATVFKAIRGRDKYIEETLGNQFLTYDKLIPKGYTIWKPDPKKGWFWANVVTDKILEKMQRGEISPHDVEAKKLLAKGRDLTWIIPEGLTTTMDNFKGQIEPAWVGKVADTAMRSWKQYILLNPYSVIRYNINNTSGDLDATLAYAPEISRKYALKAFKDLWKWHRRRKLDPAIQQEIDFAQSAGALQSGFSVQEVTDVYEVLSMDRFVKDIILDEKPNWFTKAEWYGVKPTWMKYWTFVRMMTAMRENTLRLAAYRFFMDNQDKRLYGASNPVEVDAVSDPKEKAAKLARELLGDYGNISKSGEWIRKRLCPFYSWLEINAPRYVYMMRNTKYENRDVDSIEKRAAAVTAKKLILASGKFAIRASMLMGAVTLWNLTVFPDEEEELGETGRRQMHLILGRREDGSIITLRFQGALSDALSFFALEDWPSDMKDVLQDKRTVIDKLKEAPLALLNRGVQSIRPEPKMLGEMISGKSFYPDILRPLPIRDRIEHALRTFKLDRIYREALERPGRGKTPGASRARQVAEHFVNDLKSLLVYESDPGLLAYYDTRQMVNEWLAKRGDEKTYGGRPTSKGNAFYYYKQAMKYGDLDAAQRYLNKYYELGGSLKSRLQSVKYAHPMSSISGMKRIAFRQSLTPAQEATLQRALEWYNKTYK